MHVQYELLWLHGCSQPSASVTSTSYILDHTGERLLYLSKLGMPCILEYYNTNSQDLPLNLLQLNTPNYNHQ